MNRTDLRRALLTAYYAGQYRERLPDYPSPGDLLVDLWTDALPHWAIVHRAPTQTAAYSGWFAATHHQHWAIQAWTHRWPVRDNLPTEHLWAGTDLDDSINARHQIVHNAVLLRLSAEHDRTRLLLQLVHRANSDPTTTEAHVATWLYHQTTPADQDAVRLLAALSNRPGLTQALDAILGPPPR